MRIKSPAHFYIKVLFACEGLSVEEVHERLLEENLDPVNIPYLQRVRKSMVIPEPFYAYDVTHLPSLAFVQDHGLFRFLKRDKEIQMAKSILGLPRCKEWLETMLIMRAPVSALAPAVQRTWGFKCTPLGVELYSHYFFNIDLLDSTQLRLLMALRFDQPSEENDGVFKEKKKLLDRFYHKDSRKLAAEMPATKTSILLLQQRLGVLPSKAEPATQFMAAQEQLSVRMLESLNGDSLADSQKALNYAHAARLMQELIDVVVKPEDAMKNELRKITLKTDQKECKSVYELGEARTVDVLPTEVKYDE